jgi:predicted nucleic acid-binding protein
LLPQSRRRALLSQAFLRLIDEKLDRRVLPFDEAAAEIAASLAAQRKGMGRPVDTADTQIAGIVLSRRASLVTRNIRHFADIDARLINPWDEPNSED